MIRLRPSGADEVLIKRVRDWYEPGPGVFIAPQALFNPALLFTTGVNGTWYDPSDLTTLFQDAAGTTPVTAVEQPVGLMLDKSKGLVLGPDVCTTTFPITASANGTVMAGMGSVVAGTWYKISYTVSASATTGTLYLEPTGGPFAYQVLPKAVGTYTVYAYAQDSELTFAGILLGGGAGITGSITLSSCTIQAIPGNHAFNSSSNSANFPVLSARYNLLTKTEQFDAWGGFQTSKVSNATTDPLGGLTADKVVATATAGYHSVSQGGLNFASGVAYTVSVFAKASEYSRISIADGGNGAFSATFDLSAFTATTVTGVTSKINPIGNGWFQCFVTFTGVGAPSSVVVIVGYPTGATITNFGAQYTGDGTSGIYIWGADLRVANDALNQPAYQRVNTATDYDTVGFKPYLKFNGTNQWLQTNSIDFSYGDKMFVCAGVRKLSDAAVGILSELSTITDNNNGSFFLLAPSQNATASYRTRSKGTTSVDLEIISGYPAPITNVLSGIGNISAPSATLRINGTQVVQSTATQGTGNYGSYPLYIGARAGTSLWFNGRLHQLVVAGKQASDSEIGQTEAFTNQKTGAF